MPPVLLINPNGSHAATEAMCAIARRHLPDVTGWTNPDGPQMILSAEGLASAAAQITRAVLPEARAVVVAAFGDPGADVLAARLSCPVFGIGAAAARAAAAGRAHFAVATTTPGLVPAIDALMSSESRTPFYRGCFITDGDPLALIDDPGGLDAALVAACDEAVRAGASRVIIGGGPLAEAAARIARRVGAQLVQPVPEAAQAVLRALS